MEVQAAGKSVAFAWKDFSRFVEIGAVENGWLVLWGRYYQMGLVRELLGNRIYHDLSGVRRRAADSVFELTHDPACVTEAMVVFDRTSFAERSANVI